MQQRRLGPGAAMLLGSLLALFASGCLEDKPLTCPKHYFGVIEGHVYSAGQPVKTQVYLSAVQRTGGHSSSRFRTETDSTGWYSIEAPVGAYRMWIGSDELVSYGRHGPLPPWSNPDTLDLIGEHRTIDFRLGELTVDISAPAAYEGRYLLISLYGDDRGEWSSSGSSVQVVDDHAIVDFPLLCPLTYRLLVDTRTNGWFWLPQARTFASAERVPVGADAPVRYALNLPQSWSLEGRITGSWQAMGLTGPVVSAMGADSVELTRTTVGDDGHYRLEVFFPEAVRLRVFNNGMERWMGGADFASATVYQGRPGESVSGGSYIENGIECRLELSDVLRYGRMDVLLCDSAGGPVTPPYFHPWRENPCAIPDLAPGSYYLKVEVNPQFAPAFSRWYEQVDSLSSATPIEVLPGGTVTRIVMNLETGPGAAREVPCAH